MGMWARVLDVVLGPELTSCSQVTHYPYVHFPGGSVPLEVTFGVAMSKRDRWPWSTDVETRAVAFCRHDSWVSRLEAGGWIRNADGRVSVIFEAESAEEAVVAATRMAMKALEDEA